MLEQQRQPQSPVAPSKQDDSTPSDTADRSGNIVPAALDDLGIDPVAYYYESWSEMADGWVASLRSSVETMLDPNHERIRNVTPLVPLSDVEALLEQMIMTGDVVVSHDRVDSTEDTSLP